MTERTYYWSDYDSSSWDEPDLMVDGNEETYAYVTEIVPAIQINSTNTCLGNDLGTITKVEIRAKVYADSAETIWLLPLFGGEASGGYKACPVTDTPAWSDWHDITTDNNAPEEWAWSDVQELWIHVIAGQGYYVTYFCAKLEVRVTYTLAGPETHTPSDTAKASDTPAFKAKIPLSDIAKASDSLDLKAKLPLIDTAKASDSPAFKPKIPLSDTAKASDSLDLKAKQPFSDVAKAHDSIAFKVSIGIVDTARAHDSFFPDKLSLTDVAKAHDSVTFSMFIEIETPTDDVQIFRNDLSL